MSAMICLFSGESSEIAWKDTSGAFAVISQYIIRQGNKTELAEYLEKYQDNYFLDLGEFSEEATVDFYQSAYRLFSLIDEDLFEGVNRQYMLISLGYLLKLTQLALRLRGIAIVPIEEIREQQGA